MNSLFFSLLFIGSAVSLEMQGISMGGGLPYAQLHARASLQCDYTLLDGQQLDKLGWFRDGVPVLTWLPPDEPVAGVEYRDSLDLTAGDGSLVFKKVAVEDEGTYTCTVQTKDLKQKSSEEFVMGVADVPSEGFSMKGNVANCSLHFSFEAPPIFPKPTPLCGIWSTDSEYTGVATDWQAVPYYNGSVAYSIDDTTFNVRSMPLQAGIRCEMSFNIPTGRNAENQKIVAWQNTAYYPQVSERGCPILEVGDGLMVHYKNHRQTCRGELVRQDKNMDLTATVKCAPGLYSTLRGGSVSSVPLECSGSPNWQVQGNSMAWHEFEEMECRESPMSSKVQKEHHSPSHTSMPSEDSSSATVEEMNAGSLPSLNSLLLVMATAVAVRLH